LVVLQFSSFLLGCCSSGQVTFMSCGSAIRSALIAVAGQLSGYRRLNHAELISTLLRGMFCSSKHCQFNPGIFGKIFDHKCLGLDNLVKTILHWKHLCFYFRWCNSRLNSRAALDICHIIMVQLWYPTTEKERSMFICKPCMKDDQHFDFHMMKSRGPCEICGKTKVCADCHCPPDK